MEQKLSALLTALGETKTTIQHYGSWAEITVKNTPIDVDVYAMGYVLLVNGCTVGKTKSIDVLVDVVRNYKG